ncbi:FecR domain-containing protein [uncultured Aquimarina sp.]|uniref:FecR domain-containing protein n=1 Tax=uncultured Aquimarina sp. TaxID=575652 RepID=UPI002605B9B1|nr:FecR domain-containing protein [uncultured Aquimarina sp.]
MKEDKELLKELLNTKLKDDVMESSRHSFDNIFDAVQEKSDNKSSFLWYTIGVIVLLFIGVFTLYYIENNQASKTNIEETSKEIPTQKENLNLVTNTTDTISHEKEDTNILITENATTEDINESKKDIIDKPIDVTTLEPEDEIIEKGVITVTYTASDKYASTEHTKYNKLPDSSTIVVRKNSKVNFTATKQGFRRADITGTVFLNIKSDTSKPFILFGKYSKIQITGNSFAIHSDTKGDLLTLIDGTAKVVHNSTKEVRNLIPGESLRIDQNGISSLKRPSNRFAWKTGMLDYQDTSVDQIIKDLGENYDAKILLKNADILKCTYSGSFEKATTIKVLNRLAKSLKLKISKKDSIHLITGKGCNK